MFLRCPPKKNRGNFFLGGGLGGGGGREGEKTNEWPGTDHVTSELERVNNFFLFIFCLLVVTFF